MWRIYGKKLIVFWLFGDKMESINLSFGDEPVSVVLTDDFKDQKIFQV